MCFNLAQTVGCNYIYLPIFSLGLYNINSAFLVAIRNLYEFEQVSAGSLSEAHQEELSLDDCTE